jgi:superfamily II DNA or RNA helicase
MDNPQTNLVVFKSLFKGREDVFAIRWEKGKRSGYMPAYFYDPYRYRVHKINGGTFKNFNEKSLLPLTDEEVRKHLDGVHQIGIYPLLKDNTTWFIAADFDKENWKQEAVNFLNYCWGKNVPAYLERSWSGNGGHVWIFFENPYPAIKSRKIFTDFLEASNAISVFDKASSFDRLFPNQDYLSGKGLGNLIALPLFKPNIEKGNSSFIQPSTLDPFPNQWSFLETIQKVSTDHLNSLFQTIKPDVKSSTYLQSSQKLKILLKNKLIIDRNDLTSQLINFLKEELNFSNAAYFVKKNSGRSTFDTAKYFKLIEENENEVLLPKGFVRRLIEFCKQTNQPFEFKDERELKPPKAFTFKASLRRHQVKVLKLAAKKDFGVIVSPPGAGKTIIGLKLIAEKMQPALILVHRKQLLNQWIERIESFLGIPKREIGIIGQGKSKIGKAITVATIQSLPKKLEAVKNHFGTIIIDECHHVPADTYRSTIEQLHTYYLYGLTATPFRKYNDGKIIFTHLGEVIANIQPTEIENFKKPEIIVRNTDFQVPYNSKTDNFETLSKILVHDTSRNNLILEDVKSEVDRGKIVIIITERREHIDSLKLLLKPSFEVISITGEDANSVRRGKEGLMKAGDFQIILTTGQYFGEGSDLHHIGVLFLVYPFSFEGKLIQYIGRVQRAEFHPRVYDYRDSRVDYLDKLFLKRNAYYRKIQYQATLFDEPIAENHPVDDILKVNKQVKVPIEALEFHFGLVSFKLELKQVENEIEVEIENSEIRPELEVLKPYFKKIFKSRTVNVDLSLEFEKGKLVSQIANSKEINNINKEVIESVKFHFFDHHFLKQNNTKKQNILSADDIQGSSRIFNNEESILNEILKESKYKHSRQIQYLAARHSSGIMKIRFVLQPFSFVFLIPGGEQNIIILETLDTQEATYIWCVSKELTKMKEELKKIDQQIGKIREQGRQRFLENAPGNFIRIIHDYSNERKGFIVWKAAIEEIV